jgi:Cu+-exporting ATPase
MNTAPTNITPELSAAAKAASVLRVEGMTCNNCARKVTEAIQSVPGVQSVMVNIETQRALVRWNSSATPAPDKLIGVVTAAGYEAAAVDSAKAGAPAKPDWHLNLWLGGIITLVLLLGEWVFNFGMAKWFAWVSFVLASVVQVFCGAQFYRGAWRQLKVGSSNMDTLVALGSTTAFGYSLWALFSGRGGHLYFMEAAAIITLISVGHWIEARVSARASDALKALLQLAPATARRIISPRSSRREEAQIKSFDLLKINFQASQSLPPSVATSEEEIPVAELQVGDLVVLRPGDHVPVDGEVTEGNSAVNEAMLTGESLPAEKAVGAKVYAGTANLNGRLVMRVTATGDRTALAHIIATVQRAQTSRANIQRLGDRVSNVFVPVVTVIAVLAGLAWAFAPETMANGFNLLAPYLWTAHPPSGAGAGFIIAAAVLIVACPCAMGLATPAAIMASANAAARRGILIRDGVALEKGGEITAIVFDKTGTLTVGKPEVAAVWAEQREPGEVRRWAAALARNSSHPISQTIARLEGEKVELEEWREIRGAGVTAKARSAGTPRTARLGSLRWLHECGVAVTAGEKFIAEWSDQGATIVGFALDQSLQGLFAVTDRLKPGAAAVVAQLQQQGLKTYLLTGDNAVTATSIARQINIAPENVFAEVRSEQKAELIKKLQASGARVAFVGDGINDAPALTQADLGIAVSRASDVAREAADIILLKSEIEAVPEALGLARATLRTIKQNLFWAFFYNAVGVPLAALGFMSPVLCAAAMGLSDLIVIGNALRLRHWRS